MRCLDCWLGSNSSRYNHDLNAGLSCLGYKHCRYSIAINLSSRLPRFLWRLGSHTPMRPKRLLLSSTLFTLSLSLVGDLELTKNRKAITVTDCYSLLKPSKFITYRLPDCQLHTRKNPRAIMPMSVTEELNGEKK